MLIHFYLFTTALFASLIAVPSIRRWAFETGTLDLPGERTVHEGGMPRLGGVAIFLSFFFSLLLFAVVTLFAHLMTRYIGMRAECFAFYTRFLPRNFLPARLFRHLTRFSRFLVSPLLCVVIYKELGERSDM